MADCPHIGLGISFLVWANMTSTQAHKKQHLPGTVMVFLQITYTHAFFLHDHIAVAEALNASRECL